MNSIFIHIPRTAGTYLRRSLGVVNIPDYIDNGNKHITFTHRDFTKYLPKEFIDINFKYTICRNPFDRAVSLYLYFRNDIGRISFLEFTRKLNEVRFFYNAHWMQYTFLRNEKMDYTLRFERLEEDLKKVSEILGVKIKKTGRINSIDHAPYWEYYNDESIKNIIDFYKDDFEYFGYEKVLE